MGEFSSCRKIQVAYQVQRIITTLGYLSCIPEGQAGYIATHTSMIVYGQVDNPPFIISLCIIKPPFSMYISRMD